MMPSIEIELIVRTVTSSRMTTSAVSSRQTHESSSIRPDTIFFLLLLGLLMTLLVGDGVDAFQHHHHGLMQLNRNRQRPLIFTQKIFGGDVPASSVVVRLYTATTKGESTTSASPTKAAATTDSTTSPYYMSSEMIELPKYEKLVEWLTQNGAIVSSKLEFKPSDGDGYGLFLKEAVFEDEVLFEIPRTACLTLDDALSDPDCGETFKSLIQKAGPGANTVVMAAYMAKEYLLTSSANTSSSSSSYWRPYFDTLPWRRGINNQEHMLFWNDEMIEELLKGSLCYGEATTLRDEVDLAVKVLGPVIGRSLWIRKQKDEGKLSDEEPLIKWPWQLALQRAEEKENSVPPDGFREAIQGSFCCLLTRSFQDTYGNTGDGDNKPNDESGGDESNEKLVPLLDMLQHNEYPNVKHAMRLNDGTVEVRARFAIDAGSELFNQYRSETEESMPYARFFTRFGFVPGITEPMIDLLQDKSSIFYPQKAEI